MRSYTEEQVLASVERLSVRRLRTWVKRGWVRPQTGSGRWIYSEVDVARICLFCDLREDLSIDEDTLSMIVPLIDQIHGLRQQLRTLGQAIEAQPEPVQDQIKQAFRALSND
jgi:chaperone modulatory protein CbpM